MNDLLYWFIIVFMLHELEEIIFLPSWLQKNRNMLAGRFPKLSKYVLNKIGDISTSAFALAVFEEYVIIILVTISAIYFNFYHLWIGIFMAFFIHLIVHIAQWLIVRRYVPFIATSALCLPYCIYAFKTLATAQEADGKAIVFWTIVGVAVAALNLLLAHKIAFAFDKYYFRSKK